MTSKNVIAAATREGVNVQIVINGVVLGEFFPRAMSDRTEIDVIVTCDGESVRTLRGLTDIGILFVALVN